MKYPTKNDGTWVYKKLFLLLFRKKIPDLSKTALIIILQKTGPFCKDKVNKKTGMPFTEIQRKRIRKGFMNTKYYEPSFMILVVLS